MDNTKAEQESIERQLEDVREAFASVYSPAPEMPAMPPYIIETYTDYVIVCADDETYKVAYTYDSATELTTFAPRETWIVVEEQWVEVSEETIKSGARHSVKDKNAIGAIRKAAKDIQNHTLALDPKKPKEAVKAQLIEANTEYRTPDLAIKMAGEMELDVCYMPYGGQYNGKDADGEYFTKSTKDYATKFPKPLALYYHGYEKQGVKQAEPFEIGECGNRWSDNNGRWIRIKLDASKPEAVKTWNDAKLGKARASSGSVAHLVRRENDGHITHFPVVEISVFDTSDGKRPANSYALAKPAAKARGLDVDILEDGDINDIVKLTAAITATLLTSQ